MVKSQGGNEKHIENSDLIIRAKYEKQVQSCKSGYIIHMDTEKNRFNKFNDRCWKKNQGRYFRLYSWYNIKQKSWKLCKRR